MRVCTRLLYFVLIVTPFAFTAIAQDYSPEHRHSDWERYCVTHPLLCKYLEWDAISDFAYDGTYAFCSVMKGLVIIDVSKDAPTLVSQLSAGGECRRIAMWDHVAVLVSRDSLIVIDCSDVTKPAIVGGYKCRGVVEDVVLNNDVAYLSCRSHVEIVDIADPPKPQYINSFGSGKWVWQTILRNSTVFLAETGGVDIYDVSDLHNPVLLATLELHCLGSRAAVDRDILYVGCGIVYEPSTSASLKIVDISNLSSPRIMGDLDFWGSVSDIAVGENRVYMAAARDGLTTFDVTEPESPSILNCLEMPGTVRRCIAAGADVLITQSLEPPALEGYQGYDVCASVGKRHPLDASLPTNPDSSSILLLKVNGSDSTQVLRRYR
jgi:hypothetical protein